MKKFIFFLFLIAFSATYGQCYDSTYKRVANLIAVDIVNNVYDGGSNISATINDCYYNTSNDVLTVDMIIEFYGQFSGNYYRVDGYLHVNRYTEQYSFKPYYKNTNLTDYEGMIGVVLTAATIYSLSKE